MTRQARCLAILFVFLFVAVSAEASTLTANNQTSDPGFTYRYYDASGNRARLMLSGVPMGSDTFLITDGMLDVTAGLDFGMYGLTPSGPSVTLSPHGAFLTDNVLYASGNPVLDYWGLLF